LPKRSILLLSPPGWTLSVGGPHIALPLLKRFLESRDVPVNIRDLNVEASRQYGSRISSSDAIRACEEPILQRLNDPYFSAQEKLNCVAERFGGQWDIQSGFGHKGIDLSASESVRVFSQLESPFTSFFASEVVPLVEDSEPIIVGFSVVVQAQLLPTFELCRVLRRSGFEGRIILGGNVITRIGSGLVKDWVFELIDGIVVTQGEEALLQVWDALGSGAGLDAVPNLTWKRGREIISNGKKSLQVADFEGPSFEGLHLDHYWGVSYLPVLGSRGCYYNRCSFCSIPYGWGNNGFIGHDKPQCVFKNMKESFYSSGINRFKFVDEALHPSVLHGLVELINRESFPCYFEGYARFDPFWCDSNFLAEARRAGLRKVYLGLEISPSEGRSRLGKSDLAKPVELLHKLRDSGIKAHVFCMFGYPGTGTEEAISTVEFALKYQHLIDSLDIFPFYYAKHTTVDLVKPVIDPEKDWALEYDYLPSEDGVLERDQVIELANQLENVIWKEKPIWLHPVYRLYSPWQESVQSGNLAPAIAGVSRN
jgi:hypothetical protein